MKKIIFNNFTGMFAATLAATVIGTPLGLLIWNYRDALARFTTQHFPAFIIAVGVIAIVAIYLVSVWLFTRLAITKVRQIVEWETSKKKLNELTRDIYELRRLAMARYEILIRNVEIPNRLSESLDDRWQRLTASLCELGIPYPEASADFNAANWGIYGKCILYLELLSPLAANADLNRARGTLQSINGEGIENFWTRLGNSSHWRQRESESSGEC